MPFADPIAKRAYDRDYQMSHREASRRWRENHLEQARAKDLRWKRAHPEQVKASRRARYWANPAKERTAARFAGAERRQCLAIYKVTLGCVDCGYRDHAAALDCDHLPGTVKLFDISRVASRSLSALIAELEKCEVVCANCHRVRTTDRRIVR